MFKITEIDGESCLIKYVSHDKLNLKEIDLLCRIKHPNIIHSLGVMKVDQSIAIILPLANFKSDKIISGYCTEQRSGVLYRLIHGLDFLSKNGFGEIKLTKQSVCFKDDHVYFTVDNTEGDLKTFLLDILSTSVEDPFKYVKKEYKDLCCDFISSETLSYTEILNHKLFDKVRRDINCSVITPVIDSDYSQDHRDVLKLIVHWCRESFQDSTVKLLFVAVDLFNRTASNYKEKPPLERMALGVACLSIASELLGEKKDLLSTVNVLVPGITEQMIDNKRLEVIEITDGVLNNSSLYDSCENGDELKISFNEIIMNKDTKLYSTLDTKEWISIISVKEPQHPKEIKVRDL